MPLIRLSAGLTLWAIAFCVIYGAHGLGCNLGWMTVAVGPFNLHRAVLVALWIGFTLGGIGLALLLQRHRATMLDKSSITLSWAAAGTTFIGGLPIVLIPDCL